MSWRQLTTLSLNFSKKRALITGTIPPLRFRRFCHASESESSSTSQPQNQAEDSKDYDMLKEQIKKLQEENESLTDKYKRALADMDNLRKRTQRQIDETKVFAIQLFCKDLLEVADVLDLALNSLEKAGNDESRNNMHKGIRMTKDVLLKTFSKHGLVPIKPEGEKFDPNLHEAVFEVPKDQSKYPPGHIAHVLNIGYILHNRPIRPVKVGVVKLE